MNSPGGRANQPSMLRYACWVWEHQNVWVWGSGQACERDMGETSAGLIKVRS